MEIPRTIASPADPNKPSILRFPAELRKLIFEFLFHRNGSVFLHNGKRYNAEHVRLDEEEFENYEELGLQHSDEIFRHVTKRDEEALERSKEFQHGFGNSINLLATCRQIYHEASPILYGRNSFTFSRILTRHDCELGSRWQSHECQVAYHQSHFAPEWLRGVGQSYKFLRDIRIDMDAVCFVSDCDTGIEMRDLHVDLLPLLKIEWETASCAISFVHTGRFVCNNDLDNDCEEHMLQHAPRSLREEQEGPLIDYVSVFNNLLQTLGDEDALFLRRNHRLFRDLRSLDVWCYGDHYDGNFSLSALFKGFVPLSNAVTRTETVGSGQSLKASVLKAGREVQWDLSQSGLFRQKACPLFRLPKNVLLQIRRYVEPDQEEYTIDIDAQTLQHVDLDLLRVSEKFLPFCQADLTVDRFDRMLPIYQLRLRHVNLRIAGLYESDAKSCDASFDESKGVTCSVINFLFNTRHLRGMVNVSAWAKLSYGGNGTTTLEFRVKEHPPAVTKIDLQALEPLLLQRYIKNTSAIFIVCSHNDGRPGSKWQILQPAISLLDLRRHLFMHLSQILYTSTFGKKPKMAAMPVDRDWNIIAPDGTRTAPPATEHDWDTFLKDPASSYNKINAIMDRERRKHMVEGYVGTYWHRLNDVLRERANEWNFGSIMHR